MGDSYGKLLLLLIAIAIILLAVSGKGFEVFKILTGKDGKPQTIPSANPQDFDNSGGGGDTGGHGASR